MQVEMNSSQSDGGKRLFKRIKDKIIGTGGREVEALCEHLRLLGLNATVESKKRKLLSWPAGGWVIGTVRVANRNIDLVELELLTVWPEYLYRCDYVVQASVEGLENKLKAETKPVTVRDEVVDFRWEGKELAQILNSDANLKDTLYRLKGTIFSWYLEGTVFSIPYLEIKPYRKHQCVRIRQKGSTNSPVSAFPTAETFEAYDRIAQHIRSIASCPQCGRTLPPNVKFCPYCGKTLGEQDTAKTVLSNKKGLSLKQVIKEPVKCKHR